MAVNFEKLIKHIVEPLVVSPNDVIVNTLSQDDESVHIELLVNENDLGRVIGRGGKIANAIRTIIYAGASKEGIRIYLDIDAK